MSLVYLQQESTPLLPDSIWALKWTSQNQIISGSADGHLRIWDPIELSTKPIYDLTSNPLAISSLSTTKNGKYALSTSLDGTVVLADVENGSIISKVETSREVVGQGEKELPAFTSAIHPENKCWAWSGRSSKLAIRPIEQDSLAQEQPTNGDDAETSGNGEGSSIKRGSIGGEGKSIDTGKGKFGMDLQFSPDGQSLALSTEQGQVIVLDVETQNIVATYTSHNKAVRTISWSPDSQWLYSGSDDHLIVLCDVRAGSKSGSDGKGEGAVAMMQGHQSWVLKVDASPDGKLLGSGGADSMIKLWDVGQRSCVSTTTGNSEIWGFSWQPTATDTFAAGKQFAVAGDDKAVTLFRAAGSV
ncbi:uncharacterized protein L201_000523 [Kwoniella dendrophila CBS 6074]|uniref:Anaphase-promoting complex subunit 4 WD40 domain-containing protein n=1 Tax=Kwoniella dendrophila CBS 6074 TaxID=1295534 RepID=A0AAX4JJS1_9TREE